jgi:hypothetical protein
MNNIEINTNNALRAPTAYKKEKTPEIVVDRREKLVIRIFLQAIEGVPATFAYLNFSFSTVCGPSYHRIRPRSAVEHFPVVGNCFSQNDLRSPRYVHVHRRVQ